MCAKHGTNLAGASPATGFYRRCRMPRCDSSFIIIVLLAVVGVFIYERTHVSFHSDENGTSVSIIGGADGQTSIFIAGKPGGEETMIYKQISMDQKQFFESRTDASYIILDVRRADKFAEGHIPGAIKELSQNNLCILTCLFSWLHRRLLVRP